MLRAVIFDFNGVIIDDEPLHYRSMRETMLSFGVDISMEEYWNKYLPFDDEKCLEAICRDYSLRLSEAELEKSLRDKNALYHRLLEDQFPIFPGAPELIRSAASKYPLAIASGALRDDIGRTLAATGISEYFSVVVGAEDFVLGKPHPESFLLALERLNSRLNGRSSLIQPRECLVIEDSVGGIRGACGAGMPCLAVSNTYPRERLQEANRVVSSLQEVDLTMLESLVRELS